MLGDRVRLERLIVEIASQDEGAIVRRVVPSKAEEGMLGFEVADLQSAVSLGMQTRTTAGERQFRLGQ